MTSTSGTVTATDAACGIPASRLGARWVIAGLVVLVAASLLLGLAFRHIAAQHVVELAEQRNVDLADVLTNALRQRYAVSGAGHLWSEKLDNAAFRQHVAALTRNLPVVKVKVYDLRGLTVFSTDPDQLGQDKRDSAGFRSARAGEVLSRLSHRDRIYALREVITDRNILSTYVPVRTDSDAPVRAVFELYTDVTGLMRSVGNTQLWVMLVVAGVLGLAYLTLLLAVRFTDRRIMRDHAQQNAARAASEYRATHDPLTGLPNRLLFMDRLKHAVRGAARSERLLALMFLDLDRFKAVNDNLGHEAGDAVLSEVAHRLREVVRDCDTVARLSGDEFTIILEDVDNVEQVETVAQRIIARLSASYTIGENQIGLGTSIGITVFPFDDTDHEGLIRNADAAMYVAKEAGRNNFQFYNVQMARGNVRRFALENRLRRALELDEFELHYQPKVDIKSGRMVGMEALLRWRDNEHGLISPGEFIPILEDTGMIVEVGDWVLRKACEANQLWQAAGAQPICVAVNVSPRQFRRGEFVERVGQILADSGLEPRYLELEVTEGCLMEDSDASVTKLRELKSVGVRIAVDDFGTGYSSLTYLQRFPIDTLKIDRSFVKELYASRDNASIVTAIMSLAHSLRLNVVAEGVENPQELAYLHALGCNIIQGFLFSRPLSHEEFSSFDVDSDRVMALGRQDLTHTA